MIVVDVDDEVVVDADVDVVVVAAWMLKSLWMCMFKWLLLLNQATMKSPPFCPVKKGPFEKSPFLPDEKVYFENPLLIFAL